MTPVAMSKASRFNRTYPRRVRREVGQYGFSGKRHSVRKDLAEFFGDNTQKQIIESIILNMHEAKDLQKPML